MYSLSILSLIGHLGPSHSIIHVLTIDETEPAPDLHSAPVVVTRSSAVFHIFITLPCWRLGVIIE